LLLWDPKSIPLSASLSLTNSVFHPQPIKILRFKGLLNDGGEMKVVAQSVQETYNVIISPTKWTEGQDRTSKLVFIGKALECNLLESSFRGFCLDESIE